MTHTLTDNEPRAWVGCLACYNAGRLEGAWVPGGAAAGYAPCTVPGHDEAWVFDHENYGGMLTGECSPREAEHAAELIANIVEMGYDLDAVAAYAANEHGTVTEDIVSRFGDAYQGEWDNMAEYAQELTENINGDEIPDRWPFYCIDWERAGRELEVDGYWTARTGRGTVYVFGPE